MVARTPSGLSVAVEGEGSSEVPRDERHLVVVALRAAFDKLGGQPSGLAISCTNRIPHARGLGSSSAAIVAAIVAARALVPDGTELLGDAACLRLAAEIEGHPDNVAACLLGGLTLAWCDDGDARAVRLDPHPELAPVVLVPATRATTAEVRCLLPAVVDHRDAADNAARAALLSHALTSDLSLLLAATVDRLHQDARAPAMPATAGLIARLRAQGVAAVVSGAGPAVLALVTRAGRAALPEPGPGWTLLPLDVAPSGAQVVVAGAG